MKKRIAHRVDGGRLDTASGYTMKASPAPANTSPHYSNIYSDGLHTDSKNTIRDYAAPANIHSVTDRNCHEGMNCIDSVYERWVKGQRERERGGEGLDSDITGFLTPFIPTRVCG